MPISEYMNEVRVTVGRTVNLGNFENIKKELSKTVVVRENDDANEVMRRLELKLQARLDEWARDQAHLGQGWRSG